VVLASGRSFGAWSSAGVAEFAVASWTSALRGVRDDDIGALLWFGDELETLVLGIDRGGRLGGRDREHFNALHVLLNVSAIDVPDHRSAGHERCLKNALGQFGAGGAPRGNVTIQTGYFDLNASRHRALIYSLKH
jgi:hypothetical protein